MQLLKDAPSNYQSFKDLGDQACLTVSEIVLAMAPYSGQYFLSDLVVNLEALTGYEGLVVM